MKKKLITSVFALIFVISGSWFVSTQSAMAMSDDHQSSSLESYSRLAYSWFQPTPDPTSEKIDLANPTLLLKDYLQAYAQKERIDVPVIVDLMQDGDTLYGKIDLDPNEKRKVTSENPYELESSQDIDEPDSDRFMGIVMRPDNKGGWKIIRANEMMSAGEVNISVPWLSQMPPGTDWNLTKNCGQTCTAMVFGFYNQTTPTSNEIISIDNWLVNQPQYGSSYASPYSNYTDTTILKDIAINYGHFAQSYKSNWDLARLRQELESGHPVIVAVYTHMCASADDAGHFMVARGFAFDSSGNLTGIRVNDPGRSRSIDGENKLYDVATFNTCWGKQNRAVLVVTGSQPTGSCSTPILTGPADGYITPGNTLSFTWTHPMNCANQNGFLVRVGTSAGGSNVVSDYLIQGLNGNIAFGSQWYQQDLYWSVRANSSGAPWSSSRKFRIQPNVPVPTVPAPPPISGWVQTFYSNNSLGSQCGSTRVENDVYMFRDSDGGWQTPSGCPGVESAWSVRMERTDAYFQGGDYNFGLFYDDGARLYIDDVLKIDGWSATQHYEGHYVSPGNHKLRLEYKNNAGHAVVQLWWRGPGALPGNNETQDPYQWWANYWGNQGQWMDSVGQRNEGSGFLSRDWGDGGPGFGIPVDHFSTRYERTVFFDCGDYSFHLRSDDGTRLSIDGTVNPQFDRWTSSVWDITSSVSMTAGPHQLKVDQFENGGGANIYLDWVKTSSCPVPNPIPQISGYSPTGIDAGSSGNTLVVVGTNFIPSSVIYWNSIPLSTQYADGTQVSATIPDSYVSNVGTANISVANPTPGGGNSALITMSIVDPNIGQCSANRILPPDSPHSYRNDGVGSTDHIDYYPNVSWNETGPEFTYLYHDNREGLVTVTLSDMTVDLDIFAIDGEDGCDSQYLIDYGDNFVTFYAYADRDYFIVVDGYNGVVGNYTIILTKGGDKKLFLPAIIK